MTHRTRIASAEVVVTSPGRNFTTLRVTTEDGVVGLGDATLNGRELAVAAYLREHVCPLLVGRDAFAIEDIWQYLYRGVYWRRGAVTMTAISSVDQALWDIKGRTLETPVYQLLGGASRRGLRAYGHASGSPPDGLLVAVRNRLAEGYTAVRIQAGVPGLGQIYGVHGDEVAGGSYDYEPAGRTEHVESHPDTAHGSEPEAVEDPTGDHLGARPTEEVWDTRAYLRHFPQVLAAVRAEVGPDVPILHDAHHRLTPIEAARLGKAVEPFDLFWLEDCVPAEDQAALRLVRQHTTTPLAIGEVLNSVWDYQHLISERLIDYVRSSVTHTGGITHLRKILDYADWHGIKSGMHGPTDVSPVGMAANLHLGLAIHNFGIQEYMPHLDTAWEVFTPSYTWSDGMLHPGDEPGLGITLDVDAAARFPYEPAYLPVNRLADGTVHDW